MEVENKPESSTGPDGSRKYRTFPWGVIHKNISCNTQEVEHIRQQYLDSLKQKNLSSSTIGLHDYVFRKMVEFNEIDTQGDLLSLTPEAVRLIITKLAGICRRRSMSTILPIP